MKDDPHVVAIITAHLHSAIPQCRNNPQETATFLYILGRFTHKSSVGFFLKVFFLGMYISDNKYESLATARTRRLGFYVKQTVGHAQNGLKCTFRGYTTRI